MELNDIKAMWQSYDAKVERNLKLNLHCLELIQTQKIGSKLARILWHRVVETFLHAVAIFLLVAFLFQNISDWAYALSAMALLLFYIVAFVMCIKQILIIRRIDYSNDIITIQSSLVILQTHMVNSVRLAVLCIPTFLAYPMVVSKAISDLQLDALAFMDIRANYAGDWWTVQITVMAILIPLCLIFYRQVSYKNIHKEWVKLFILKTTGKRVTKAMELANELQDLRSNIA
jgi:hypothetical protein